MKKVFMISLLSAFFFLLIGCDKDDDDKTKEKLLLFLIYQNSGNCATTMKLSANYYITSADQTSRATCCDQNNYYTDASSAINDANNEYRKVIEILTAAGSTCDSSGASVSAAMNARTVSAVTAAANAATPKCSALMVFPKMIVFCVNSSEVEANKNIFRANTRYTVLSDARTDAGFSAQFAAAKTALSNAQSTNGLTTEAINNATLWDNDMYGLMYRTAIGVAYQIALTDECRRSLLSADSNLRSQMARYGISTTLGIAQADVNRVTKAVAATSVSCCSGSSCVGTRCSSEIPTGF